MRKLNAATILCTLLTVLLLTACQPIRPDQDSAGTDGQTEPAGSTTSTLAPPATLLTLQPPTAGEALTADEVFAAVSPAVAFVDSPSGTGNAILIQGNYLLTNANIVWPYTEARVVFPDGSEHPAAPVAGWDLFADLALIGPIDTQIEPAPLVDAGDLPVGSKVYLIGYTPSRVKDPSDRPTPTISTGVLARLVKWEPIGYTFFKVDVAARKEEFPLPTFTTGILARLLRWETFEYTYYRGYDRAIREHTGGVMVTDSGDVVGISTFNISGFELAGSIADALPRLNTILGHDLGVTIEQRGIPQGEGQLEFERTLRDSFDEHRFLLHKQAGAEIEIVAKGQGSRQFSYYPLGDHHWTGNMPSYDRSPRIAFTASSNEFSSIVVSRPSENGNSYLITSSHPLLPFPDPDDRRTLAVGDSYLGALDVPYDLDVFELNLNAGEKVQIDVDSIVLDPMIILLEEKDELELVARDDDGGGGLLGESSRILYEAPQDGTYMLLVVDPFIEDVGGYFVKVTAPTEAALQPGQDLIKRTQRTPHIKITLYGGDSFDFPMVEQRVWVALPGEDCGQFVLCNFWDSSALLVAEFAFHELPPQERSREGFIRSLDSSILHEPGSQKLSAEKITTRLGGLELDLLKYNLENGGWLATMIVYVDETQDAVFAYMAFNSHDTRRHIDSDIELIADLFRVREAE